MKEKIIEKVNDLPYFSKNNLKLFQDNADFTFNENIKKWLKKELMSKIKNGLYVTRFYLDRRKKTEYEEFIANILTQPSYISLEYALQKYNILSEGAFSFSSVTTKSTRGYENFLGSFNYSSIKPELFCGFFEEKEASYPILIASKAKAIFDYVYFRKNIYSAEAIEELRFNWEELDKKDFIELKKYIKMSKNKKMKMFYDNLLIYLKK